MAAEVAAAGQEELRRVTGGGKRPAGGEGGGDGDGKAGEGRESLAERLLHKGTALKVAARQERSREARLTDRSEPSTGPQPGVWAPRLRVPSSRAGCPGPLAHPRFAAAGGAVGPTPRERPRPQALHGPLFRRSATCAAVAVDAPAASAPPTSLCAKLLRAVPASGCAWGMDGARLTASCAGLARHGPARRTSASLCVGPWAASPTHRAKGRASSTALCAGSRGHGGARGRRRKEASPWRGRDARLAGRWWHWRRRSRLPPPRRPP